MTAAGSGTLFRGGRGAEDLPEARKNRGLQPPSRAARGKHAPRLQGEDLFRHGRGGVELYLARWRRDKWFSEGKSMHQQSLPLGSAATISTSKTVAWPPVCWSGTSRRIARTRPGSNSD